MPDVETPPVTTPEALATRKVGGALLERWVTATDMQAATAQLDMLARALETLRLHAIRQTYPTDWVIHSTVDRDGAVTRQAGYLQDSGAERAGKIFGVEVGKPVITREDMGDGTFAYHMTADAWSKVTGEMVEHVEGSRWSGDKFFTARIRDDEPLNPVDIRKAAYANLHGRAVRALTGLTAVPLESLKAAGLDTAKCLFVGYAKGDKGGESVGASTGSADVTMPFGNSKGQTAAQLADKDLDWYLGVFERDLTDPAKAKFKRNTERLLGALRGEKERRALRKEQEEATGAAPGEGESGAPTGGGRGALLANVHTLLSDATGKNQRLVGGLLKAFCKEWETAERAGLSDFTDEELGKIAVVPPDVLRKMADQVKAAGGAK